MHESVRATAAAANKLRLVTSANSTGPRDKILQSLIGLLSSYVLAMHLWDLKHGRVLLELDP